MYQYRATVKRWVDGDTVEMFVDMGFRTSRIETFRLLGINTPERGQPGYHEARARAEQLMPVATELVILSERREKYGRYLISLPLVSDVLIAEGLGVPFMV